MRSLDGAVIAALCAAGVTACTPQQQAQSQHQVNQAVQSIPSPVKAGAEDAGLTAQVAAAMAAQTGVNAFTVKPSAHRGVVTLTGTVPTPEIKSTLLAAVRRVHGVTEIIDHVTVRR